MGPNSAAVKEQQYRDLTGQLSGVDASLAEGDQPEVAMRETSPRTVKETIYSLSDGEPIQIPRKLLRQTLAKRNRTTGQYMFTAYKDQAPEYKLGEIKCFLHPESPERKMLNEIGMAEKVCMSAHLANGYAKRQHGLHRHKEEWAAYRDYVDDEKERVYNERQERQLEATLELARTAAGNAGSTAILAGATGASAQAAYGCEDCGATFPDLDELLAHSSTHKAEEV